MAIRFGNGFSVGTSNGGSLNFFTNLVTMSTYLRNYMSDFRNPDFYEYSLDGDTGFYIHDGGGDMYDDANATSPWLISNATYTGSTDYSTIDYPYAVNYETTETTGTIDTSFGYISLGYNYPNSLPLTVIGTRATIASAGTPIGFQCGGNIGADGNGTFVEGNIYTGDTVSGFTVHSYYKQTYDAGDPSVCDVFILLGHPDWNSVFGDVFYGGDSSNQGSGSYLYTTGGGAQNVLAIKTLLSKENSDEVTFSEVNTVVDNFILRVNEVKNGAGVSPTPSPTPTPTPSSSSVTPTPTPTPSSSPAPMSQYTPNGTNGGNGLITYLDYTAGLNGSNHLPDQSTFTNNFTYTGTNPYTSGVTGYTFLGTGNFASAISQTQYNQIVNSMTIELWFKVPTIPGSMSLIAAGAGSSSGGWALRLDGSGNQINLVKYNIADQSITLPNTLQTNTWYHLVVAQGGTSLTFYLNGEIVGALNDATTNNFSFTSGTVNISRDYYTTTNSAMSLGTLKIYDNCRLTADIVSEYNSTKSGYGIISPTPTPTSTVTPTSSIAATATPTSSVTPTASIAATATPTPTSSVTPTVTPTDAPAPSVTPTATPSMTPSATLSASAPMVVTIYNSGSNVVMSASGTVNLSGLTLVSSSVGPFGNGGLGINNATFMCGANGSSGTSYSGFTSTPSNFGTGTGLANSSGTGQAFGVIFDMTPPYLLVVPTGYTSGANISSTQTFTGQTLSSLGLTNGTYTYTWSGGSIDVVVGGPAPTPTPSPSTGAVTAGWNFYEASGNSVTLPPLSNGQTLFYTSPPPVSTLNPNNVGGTKYLMFYKNDSAGTSYETQFQNLLSNGGTINVTQNGQTATYVGTPGAFNYDSGGGFMVFSAALQTATVASAFTYNDKITLTFS